MVHDLLGLTPQSLFPPTEGKSLTISGNSKSFEGLVLNCLESTTHRGYFCHEFLCRWWNSDSGHWICNVPKLSFCCSKKEFVQLCPLRPFSCVGGSVKINNKKHFILLWPCTNSNPRGPSVCGSLTPSSFRSLSVGGFERLHEDPGICPPKTKLLDVRPRQNYTVFWSPREETCHR